MLALSLASMAASADPATETPATPTVAPANLLEVDPPVAAPTRLEAPTLDNIRRHLRNGDERAALGLAQDLVATAPWGRDAAAAWMVIGTLHRDAGRHNLAAEAFTRVRMFEGPLAPWGTFYEAEQDLARGRPQLAVRECERYRTRWPEGGHADGCLRIIAAGWAAQGREREALDAARAYDTTHENGPIREQIELELAQVQATTAPQTAIRRLEQLATRFVAPLTERIASSVLDGLRSAGHAEAVLPTDIASLQQRAVSLRESGRLREAMAAFEALTERAPDDPALARWVDDEETLFGWKTRSYTLLDGIYAERYAEEPDGDTAWWAFRSASRDGRYADALVWAKKGLEAHGNTRRWKGATEEIARAQLLAGAYADARASFDKVSAQGGWTGRRGAFFAAFSAFEAGELDDALTRWDRIVAQGSSYQSEGRYWRARTLLEKGEEEAAAADLRAIIADEPHDWYAVLARQRLGESPSMLPWRRDGGWPALPTEPEAEAPADPGPTPLWADGPGQGSFTSLTWTLPAEADTDTLLTLDPDAPPMGYPEGAFFDEDASAAAFTAFAAKWGQTWPELGAVEDLSRAGLHDLAGPLFSAFYEDWRDANRQSSHAAHAVARKVDLDASGWRSLFLFARDHHHATRFTTGLDRDLEDEAVRRNALQLNYPLAHAHTVWSHAREADLDPYLVLGLMRSESVYDANALSRVGARGPMQIMPRTGHLLADLARDTAFTADDLTDPEIAIGYGLDYLGLLMRRFDGVYPLAVASYNGGPHNVSSWLKGTGTEMPLDEWVEHIPFKETRLYVKKVSAAYATYLDLYGPDGAAIVLPDHPAGDDASVVDF